MRVSPVKVLFMAVIALLMARPAAAEDWPSRPVVLVLSFAGGGMMDFAARSIAQDLTAVFGHPVVVETKQGGGGLVGAGYVAKAAPDGYTLLVTAIGPMVFRPLMDKNVGFDADKDFTPLILVGDTPNVILASPQLGVGSIKELLAYAGRHNNQLSIAHPGPGTMGHLCGALFAAKTHINGNLVAYRGAAQIIADLRGGQVEIGTPAYGPGSDAVKVLAVTGEERLPSLPDVPTLKESGLDVECATWIAIYGPPGLPAAIVGKLNAAMDAYLRKADTREQFGKLGLRPLGGPPERLRNRVIADRKIWAPIIGGMKFDSAN